MTGVTHKIGGIAAGTIAIAAVPVERTDIKVIVLTGAVVGSLLPDIDQPRSTIGRKLKAVSWGIGVFRFLLKISTCLLPVKEKKYIRGVAGHRGITHSLLACFMVMGAFYLFRPCVPFQSYYVGLAEGVIVGMWSHIFLDMLSNGVPLFTPISNKRIVLARIKTGGIREWLVRVILLLLAGILAVPKAF
ncbi:metal-dependent hydrolase [Anaeromicropila populeti]|uniref:Inner membrane protein n=1 Tax=Anaeromicropila populeti TaxID=37658 RepID=A0A1I6KS53_9FIRM|nr:metal-dependent hydrolase [Anaeromicropila populeti]SFR93858.1 inner membrane protein [Anaeromicropila populeti]